MRYFKKKLKKYKFIGYYFDCQKLIIPNPFKYQANQ